jgi:hypothetical protein
MERIYNSAKVCVREKCNLELDPGFKNDYKIYITFDLLANLHRFREYNGKIHKLL